MLEYAARESGDFILIENVMTGDARRRLSRDSSAVSLGPREPMPHSTRDLPFGTDLRPFASGVRIIEAPPQLVTLDPTSGQSSSAQPLDAALDPYTHASDLQAGRGVFAAVVGQTDVVTWLYRADGVERHDVASLNPRVWRVRAAAAADRAVVTYQASRASNAQAVRFDAGIAQPAFPLDLPERSTLESVGIRADDAIFVTYGDDRPHLAQIVDGAIVERFEFDPQQYPLASDIRLMSCDDELWAIAFGQQGPDGYVDIMNLGTDTPVSTRAATYTVLPADGGRHTSRFMTDAIAVCGPRGGLLAFRVPEMADEEVAIFVVMFGLQ